MSNSVNKQNETTYVDQNNENGQPAVEQVGGCAGCGCADCQDVDSSSNEPVSLVKDAGDHNSAMAARSKTGKSRKSSKSSKAIAANAKPVPPGNLEPGKWVALPRQQGLDPDASRAIIESRPLPGNIYVPGATPIPNPNPGTPADAKSLAVGFAGNTVAGPASIVELARALKANVDLIYEWVFNNIENLPNYGLSKGGLGAVIDGMGCSFEQSDLMIQLLREAGYTANYQHGTLRMNAAQAGAWLGTDPLNIWASNNLLANSGVPVTVVNVSGVDYVEFSHCWVLCNISGTNYVFDPARKSYTTVAAVNLGTATGFNATTFMNRARTGATITADYVKDLNRANIRSDLNTMTGNLVTWIKANKPAGGLGDILGGRNIVQNDASTPLRQTTHPFLKPGSAVTTWTSIPQAYKTTLHVYYDGIDLTFNTHDLAGKRLTLTFNASHQGELRLDGTILGTSVAQTPGTWNSVLFDIVHPYAFTWANQYVWQRVWADKPYLLCNSWGNIGISATSIHGAKLQELTANWASNSGEPVVGETMAQMWKTLDSMTSRTADIVNRLSNCTTVMHHQCGLIGWFDTAFTDIGAVVWSTSALDNNYTQQEANDTVLAQHGVALEAQITREFQTTLGISATSIVDKAITLGQKIYDGNTANWLTNVKPNLTGYAAGDLTNIENWYINNGYRVGLPESGAITIESWTGYGYYAIPTFGTYGIIGGGLKGASASWPVPLWGLQYLWREQNWDVYMTSTFPPPDCATLTATYNASVCGPWAGQCICWIPRIRAGFDGAGLGMNSTWQIGASGPGGGGGSSDYSGGGGGSTYYSTPYTSAEPIDLASGAYLLDATDLTIGSGPGLAFSRQYTSAARNQHGPIGRGWRHNHQIYVTEETLGFAGLGQQTVLGAAAAITEIFVSYNLQLDLTKPFDKYLTCAVANMWFVDQLSNNVLSIQSGFDAQTFVKLPDGTYTPPVGDVGTIVKNVGGTYTYTSLTGVQMNFNNQGHISTIVDPAGVTLTYGYDANKRLSTIANNMGRTLTLTYSGNALASVSDGTGRSVSYTIDTGTGNLTSVTDPNSKVWSFQYDQPGRMVKLFKPANPTVAVATNVYDSLHRIKQQKDYQLNTWDYFFAGSRSEERNPNGKSSVLYFNGMGKAVKSINQIGKKTLSSFDAKGRLVKTVAPEGNSVEFVYDSKNRLTQTTVKPKTGAGSIVTSATYDPTWQKVKTTTDNLGRVTTFNYDPANGNLLSVVSPAVTGVGASTVSMTYNARGQVLTVTDPLGMVTKNTYHGTNETLLSTVVDFGVGRLNLTANFGYNSRGDVTSVQNPRGYTTTMTVDVLRRVTQVTATAPFSYVTKFTFDDNGNKTKVEKQTNDVLNPWQTSTATYTADGKILTATDPQLHTTTFDYDSVQRLWKVTDALSRVVTRAYDDCNRLFTVTDPTSTIAVTYGYTDNGKLASLKDSRNYTTSYTFDRYDRPDRTTYPDTTYEQVTSYDGNSNPLTVRNRAGQVTTLTYDELNRVKTKAPASMPTVTTVYDLAGRVTSISTPVVAGDPASGAFTYSFDTANRPYKETYPDTKYIEHVLDANGNVTKTTYPDGSYYVERVYDQLDRLTDIKLNGAVTSAVQFQYDALSRRKKLIFENGVTTDYGFEIDNDLNSLVQTFVGSSLSLTYGFNDVGEMTSQQMSDGTNYMWHPSAAGTTNYGTADSVNKYPTVGGVAQSFNTNGCLTGDGTWTFGYNTENMLISASKTGVSVSYKYDPLLRQRQKTVGSVKSNYYYAGWQRLADYDGTTNTLQQRYVYGASLDEILIQINSAGTKTYYHGNHQGSVIAITNASGAVINRYKYGPFGESPSMAGTTHGYTGQRYDADTGLYYYKMRYYRPETGRFLQPDPIGYCDSLNMYSYAHNHPSGFTDPLGLAGDTSNGGDGAKGVYNSSSIPTSIELPLTKTRVDLINPNAGLLHIIANHYPPGAFIAQKSFFYPWGAMYGLETAIKAKLPKNIWVVLGVSAAALVAGAAVDMAIILLMAETAMRFTRPSSFEGDKSIYILPYSVIQRAMNSSFGTQLPAIGYDAYAQHEANAVKVVAIPGSVLITAFPIYDPSLPAVSGPNGVIPGMNNGIPATSQNVSFNSFNSLLQYMGLIPRYTGAFDFYSPLQ